MSFIETRFPECVSLGALSKPRYKTNVIPNLSGYTSRTPEWAQPLHSFDFAHNALTAAEHAEVLAFFHAMYGAGHSFRVKDYSDYFTTTATGVFLPIVGDPADVTEETILSGNGGYGYGVPSSMAAKMYTAGGLVTYRYLQKLVPSTSFIYRNGVLQPHPVQARVLNPFTGRLDTDFDQFKNIASHTNGVQHQFVTTGTFSPAFVPGGRVYITGAFGAGADDLNFHSHEIVSQVGTTITIDFDTSVNGITSGGQAFYYPQPSETMTIVTEFDVPCSFASDEASFQLFNRNETEKFFRWSGITIEEERIRLGARTSSNLINIFPRT